MYLALLLRKIYAVRGCCDSHHSYQSCNRLHVFSPFKFNMCIECDMHNTPFLLSLPSSNRSLCRGSLAENSVWSARWGGQSSRADWMSWYPHPWPFLSRPCVGVQIPWTVELAFCNVYKSDFDVGTTYRLHAMWNFWLSLSSFTPCSTDLSDTPMDCTKAVKFSRLKCRYGQPWASPGPGGCSVRIFWQLNGL